MIYITEREKNIYLVFNDKVMEIALFLIAMKVSKLIKLTLKNIISALISTLML